jgi:hypothetical protein
MDMNADRHTPAALPHTHFTDWNTCPYIHTGLAIIFVYISIIIIIKNKELNWITIYTEHSASWGGENSSGSQ